MPKTYILFTWNICSDKIRTKTYSICRAFFELGWVITVRILMQPIEMIAWFTLEGTPNPIRYKMPSDDASNIVVKVDRVVTRSEEKLAGNRMFIFRCQSEINGLLKLFELKYELNTCKWYLYKT